MIEIIPIAGTDVILQPGDWPLPADMRAAVPEAWSRIKARTPLAWDGRILGFLPSPIVAGAVLQTQAREDAYSALLTWRDAGYGDIGIVYVFGVALIASSDGALIFGVMGGDTINAGRVYPPGGSLEPRDVMPDGRIDVEGCIATELQEETGLRATDARLGPMLAIVEGSRLALGRVFYFDQTSDQLLSVIRANLDLQDDRELADVVACRTVEDGWAAGDLVPYAAHLLAERSAGRLAL